jgi:hypothetical protein
MEPGSDGIATVMEPPVGDRWIPCVGDRRIPRPIGEVKDRGGVVRVPKHVLLRVSTRPATGIDALCCRASVSVEI